MYCKNVYAGKLIHMAKSQVITMPDLSFKKVWPLERV